jgi:molybdenum cofactor biosynthesis enzyme MoaA
MTASDKEIINNPLNLPNVECSTAFAPDNNKNTVSRKRLHSEDIIKIMEDIGNYHKDNSAKDCWGPSEYYIDESKKSKIGLITNSNKACFSCNRLRLSPEGTLRLCLFSDMEMDLKALLRSTSTNDDIIKKVLIDFIKTKPENRQSSCVSNDLKLPGFMNRIGG